MASHDPGVLNGLVLRVDDHLIHGQILYGWVHGWPTDEVWLVSDRVANDPGEAALYRDLLEGVSPGGILTINAAIEQFGGTTPHDQRILMILESCGDLARLISGGVVPKEAHLGNLAGTPDRRRISPSVALGPQDLNTLDEIQRSGVVVMLRDLPSSTPVPVGQALQETNL